MLNTEDKNVPGKKSVVSAAIFFIAVPSALASRAMVVLVVASCCVTKLKTFHISQFCTLHNGGEGLRGSRQYPSATCSSPTTAFATRQTPTEIAVSPKPSCCHLRSGLGRAGYSIGRERAACGAQSWQSSPRPRSQSQFLVK